ncbi:hypothetical protein MPSEU_000683800 [Mayamaea pseudoterrestris]|nr:hypothetical protein MPSEU_000683800 [Mayamaea pseudoterrestris]
MWNSLLLFLLTRSLLSFAWVPGYTSRNLLHCASSTIGACRATTTTSSVGMSSTDTAAADETTLEFAEIIGGGRIGSLLARAGNCRLLGRSDSIDPDRTGAPILVATRNDALQSIVQACPEHRRNDLVFLQNGYLDDFLASHGLQDNTQVLLYVSVTAKGADPIDGVTAVNPEGLTTATGKHAQAFANRLAALNLKCNVVSAEEYRPSMFEKLIWISTYMLVGTAKDCASVGAAGKDHKELVGQVIRELVNAVSAKEGIAFADGTVERLAAYTDVVTDFPCAVKEFEWRNEYFYKLGDEACPTHNKLLRECADAGKLSFDLS